MRIRELERRAAAPDPDVEVVERDRTHPDADLAGARHRVGHLLANDDLGAAVRADHHRFHGAERTGMGGLDSTPNAATHSKSHAFGVGTRRERVPRMKLVTALAMALLVPACVVGEVGPTGGPGGGGSGSGGGGGGGGRWRRRQRARKPTSTSRWPVSGLLYTAPLVIHGQALQTQVDSGSTTAAVVSSAHDPPGA